MCFSHFVREVISITHQMLGEKSESEILERVTGVGPVSSPWKGDIIPLYDTRFFWNYLFD